MSKLQAHFKAMQSKAAELIMPGAYHEFSGDASAHAGDSEAQEALFIGDMLHMLDGPEQRAAEAEAGFDYIAEANLTLSNNFHGEKVTLAELRSALQGVVDAGNRLDKIKKALFYGKGEDIGLTNAPASRLASEAPYRMAGIPSIAAADSEYREPYEAEAQRAIVFIHGIIGKATESAELVEALQAAIFGEHKLDEVNTLEEIGDGFWYDAILLKVLGFNFDGAQVVNINKLRKRFPNAFTEHDAINRDLPAERTVLEGYSGVGGTVSIGGKVVGTVESFSFVPGDGGNLLGSQIIDLGELTGDGTGQALAPIMEDLAAGQARLLEERRNMGLPDEYVEALKV